MIEPASLGSFFTIFFSSAMVILLGAMYALLFALSRLKTHAGLLPLAYLAYLGLFVSTLFMAEAANLLTNPLWASLVVFMLLGYLIAPHAIWHLCVATHAEESAEPEIQKE